jgi:nucleoside-diphosphate-sugar epimerase
MNVLITGGMGYLGSVIIGKLLEKGIDVKVLDSLIYGSFVDHKKTGIELVNGDIRDHKLLQETTTDVDAVIHLAGIIGDAAANLDKESTIRINYLATRELATLCGKKGLRFIFSSTCSVYGARPNELIREDSPIAPLSLYAMSKLLAEESILKRCDNYAIFRLGTLFGLSPRMRFDLVINKFIAQAIQDREISVYGGLQRRPFIHVQDVSDIFIKALGCNVKGTYILGGTNYKIQEAAEVIKQKTGCKVKTFEGLKDPRDYAVDSSCAEKVFGFKNIKKVEFAVDEIKNAYAKRIIKDYQESTFNNEEWLKQHGSKNAYHRFNRKTGHCTCEGLPQQTCPQS